MVRIVDGWSAARQQRHLVLDSSVVADLARDLENSASANHRDARELCSLLFSAKWLPTLSLLQVSEIAQHRDPGVVQSRIRFLQRFPRIAWIRNTEAQSNSSQPYHGSILDLIYNELGAWRPDASPPAICASLRKSTFVVALDQSYVEEMVLTTAAARRRLDSDQHARRVASVACAMQKDVVHTTVAQVRRKITNDPVRVATNLARRFAAIREQLQRRADPRATNLDPYLRRELAMMIADAQAVLSSPDDPFTAYLARHGLRPSDVDDTDSMRDVGELAALRLALQLLAETRSVSVSDSDLARIRPRMLPSYFLDCLLRRKQIAQGDQPRGSDLIDASIAPMALYADLTIVDKRTQEAMRQVRHEHPELRQALGRTMRWSVPSHALRVLSDE